MGSIWDILYDLLFQPRTAMDRIGTEKNLGQALLVGLVSIIIPIWAVSFGMKDTSMATMIHVIIGVKIIGSIFVWILGSALLHFIAECFGGRGTALGLFAALGFAHVPRMFIVPLWALATAMPAGSTTIVTALSVLIIMFWSLFLDVVAIREVHQLTTAKAVLVMIMPMLLIGLLCLVCFIFISSSLIHMPMWG